ncbi:MAG: hypothetical protein R3Y46_07670 [Opitutales bacterium]
MMNIDSPELLGLGLSAITALMATYYLILKIKDIQKENPDPKLTYVTYAQMDKVRNELMRIICESEQELRTLRSEIRDDSRQMLKQYLIGLGKTRDLISKNAQDISSLIAHTTTITQRVNEISIKVDKFIAKH